MGVLAAVLAHSGNVALDVARILGGVFERRGEQADDPLGLGDEMLLHRVHRLRRARSGGAAPESTAHAWASASMRHSSLAWEPSGVPSS